MPLRLLRCSAAPSTLLEILTLMMTSLPQHPEHSHTHQPQLQQQQHLSSQALVVLEQQPQQQQQVEVQVVGLDCPHKPHTEWGPQ
jgi:hypothetical protein